MASEPCSPTLEAIRLWSGVECPNAAGRRSLDDFPALIREFEALRGTLVFEDEPSSWGRAARGSGEGRMTDLATLSVTEAADAPPRAKRRPKRW